MIVTFDSTTLLAGVLASQGTLATLFDLVTERDNIEIVLSEFILDEVARGLKKPYFAARVSAGTADTFLGALRRWATVVPLEGTVRDVVSDPNDDPIIETAVRGNAEYLITSDKRVRAVTTYQNVQIVTPQEFLAVLQNPKREDGQSQ